MTTSQPSRLLYCYLRKKYTTLEFETVEDSEGDEAGRRTTRCLDMDGICAERRCRLSPFGSTRPEEARDPWFDE